MKKTKITTIEELVSLLKEVSKTTPSNTANILIYDDGSGHIATGYASDDDSDHLIGFDNVEKLSFATTQIVISEDE